MGGKEKEEGDVLSAILIAYSPIVEKAAELEYQEIDRLGEQTTDRSGQDTPCRMGVLWWG